MPLLMAYLKEDTPQLNVVIEVPFYTGSRIAMPLAELFEKFEEEFGRLIEVGLELTL